MANTKERRIGSRLRNAREEMGLTQAAFAQRFGLSPRTAQSYERGDTYPSGELLAALAELGIDITEILSGRPVKRSVASAEDANFTSIVTHPARSPLQPGELDLEVLQPVLQATIEESRAAKDIDWARTAQRFAYSYARQYGEIRGRR